MNGLDMTVDPNRVAVYIRWSTEEQSEGTTLEVQRESCQHYLLAQGWKFRENLVFVDEGFSGGTMDRPALAALRKAVRAGKVSCVVVFKLDRLSRSVVDTVNLVLQEWEGLCFIKSTREPVDTTSSAGKMFFYMLASYAEWERSVIKERTMSGKIKRAQQGKNPGFTAPYGFGKGEKPGQWVVEESEAAIVRRVFDEYISGKGIHAIAACLYNLGIKPRRANRWHATTIAQMLTNTAYLGVLAYGRTSINPKNVREVLGKVRMTHEEPRYARVEGALPVIISPEVFEKVQRVHDSKAITKGKRALSVDFLLTGIARCTCGGSLRGDSRSGRGGHRYYRCANTVASRPTPCGSSMIRAGDLEEVVVSAIRQAFDPANREMHIADWTTETQADIRKAEEALFTVREALGAIAKKRARLDADYDAGDLPAKLYTSRVDKLEEEQYRLELAEREGVQRLEGASQGKVDMTEFEELAAKVDVWENLTPAERKQVLRFAVSSCIASRAPSGVGKGHASASPLEVSVKIWRPSSTSSGVVFR